MKRLFYLTGLVVLLAGCNSFKKTKGGLLYKVISNGQGQKLEYGNFFEIAINQEYKDAQIDTILISSKDKGNQMGKLDSLAIPADYFAIFTKVRLGDSVIIKLPTDSIFKKSSNLPPFIKRDQYIITTFKIVNIFTDQKQADSARAVEMAIAKRNDSIRSALQLVKDDKIIADYLAQHKITAVKAPLGTYVAIANPGTGDLLDTGKVPKVLYTGRTLSNGKVFDSNMDSAFHHTDAIPIDMNPEHQAVIKGWLDALPLLRKGAKATFYIPSALAYGAQGGGGAIGPNENLVFDVEIVDAMTTAQAKAEAEAARAKQMAEQKHLMDSMRTARSQDSVKRGLK